jgi:small subunit ribosomal protein S8
MDTIGEFLTRVRNAGLAKHEKVDVPASKIREGIAKILAEQGYIRSFKTVRDGRQGMMRVYLRYDQSGNHAITNIERVSRPGRRIFWPATEIPKIRSGFGTSVLTTSKGIMTGDVAREKGVGGEVLFKVW